MSALNPLVSVIVPTYNRSSFLQAAIESIFAQSFTDFEIIISDNNSTDDTEAKVREMRDERIVYIRNKYNLGVSNNHNRALREAKGKYIYVFSDDDLMLPDNLAIKVQVMEENPSVGLVHSDINIIDENGLITSNSHWASYWRNYSPALGKVWQQVTGETLMLSQKAFSLLYYNWNFISMPSVLMRTQLLNDNRLEFNNQLAILIDWDLWLKIAEVSDFYYIDKPLVSYRIHSSNTIKKINSAKYFQEILAMKICFLTLFQRFDIHGHHYLRELEKLVNKQLIEAREMTTSGQRIKQNLKSALRSAMPAVVVRNIRKINVIKFK